MLKILFNTILGLILIYIWSRFVDLPKIFATLSHANLFFILFVFLFSALSALFRAIRLKIFLSEIKKINLKDLFFLNGVAVILNFFIPIRAGEIAKGVYLNTKYQITLAKSIVWIFIDRFVDFLVVLLMAGWLLTVIPTALNITVIKIIIIILSFSLVLAYLAVFQLDFSKKIVNFLRPLFIEKHIKIYYDKFTNFILDSFSILDRHPKDLALMFLITILAYGADAIIWYFTFLSLGINMDFLKMYLGQILTALTYLIPAAPGYVGSAEASGLLILSGIFGIDSNLASAMIVLLHIITAIFVLVFGLVSIFFLKIDVGQILKTTLKRR